MSVQSVPATQPAATEQRRPASQGPGAPAPANRLPRDVVERRSTEVRPSGDPRLAGDVPEPVLVGIAAWGSEEQALAVAGRADLPGSVARALSGRGSWPTLRALAANAGTAIPEDVLDGMAAAAGRDGPLARALLGRADIPAEMARSLVSRVTADGEEERGELSGIDPATLTGRGKDDADDVPGGTGKTRAEIAAERVDVLAKLRPLRPADIALCMRLGRIDEAMGVVAKLAGVPTPTAVRAFQNGDVTFAMNQMRAIGLDDATAGWLLRSVGRTIPGGTSANEGVGAYTRASRLGDRAEGPALPEDEEPYRPMDMRV